MHKTQVFISPEGDHYRTRLTHTLEAAGSPATSPGAEPQRGPHRGDRARPRSRPPAFGHIGEAVLDACLKRALRAALPPQRALTPRGRADRGPQPHRAGARRDPAPHGAGAGRRRSRAGSCGSVDRIAYINHDIDDALRAGVLRFEDLPREEIELLGDTGSARIETLGPRPARALRGGGRHRPGGRGGRGDAPPAQVHVRPRLPRPGRPAREAADRAHARALFDHYAEHPPPPLGRGVVATRSG